MEMESLRFALVRVGGGGGDEGGPEIKKLPRISRNTFRVVFGIFEIRKKIVTGHNQSTNRTNHRHNSE